MIMRSSVRGVTTLRNELTDFFFDTDHYAAPLRHYAYYVPITCVTNLIRAYYAYCACYAPVTDVTHLLRALQTYYAPITRLLRAYYAPITDIFFLLRRYLTEIRNDA